jgi:hypothetical protein
MGRSQYPLLSYSQFGLASPIVSTGQPLNFPSNPPSGPSSTMVQMAPSTKAFEVPPSITAVQSQYQLMVPRAERGLIQASVGVQAASKVAGEKRRRNSTVSHNFRQRRKEKEQKTSENIANLEAQRREMKEEIDHYRTERDYFRDLAIRRRLPVAPRPPSPKRQRYAAMNGASLVIKKLRVMDKMAGIPYESRGSRLKTSYHQLRGLHTS